MTTLRNLTLVAVAAVVLLAPGASWVAAVLQRQEPKSWLEGRSRPKLPAITGRAIVTGMAQDAMNVVLAFSVPERDRALLAQARLQRDMIRYVARLFAFAAYPTFYGSRHCRIEGGNAIAPIPDKISAKRTKELADSARQYAAAMQARPDIRWFFAPADWALYSMASPLHGLVAHPLDYEYFRKHLLTPLRQSCAVIDLGYDAGEDLYNDYFRTDHHWRVQGAVRAYGRIAEALGIAPVEFGPIVRREHKTWFGSLSRLGLDLDVPGDAVFDVVRQESPLLVTVEGRDRPESFLKRGKGRQHRDRGLLRIINESLAGGALLVVGDSYSNILESFFAESYRVVYKLDPRHTGIGLAEFLYAHPVDDALFLLHPGSATRGEFLRFLSH